MHSPAALARLSPTKGAQGPSVSFTSQCNTVPANLAEPFPVFIDCCARRFNAATEDKKIAPADLIRAEKWRIFLGIEAVGPCPFRSLDFTKKGAERARAGERVF
jgi:hypothetical protein